MDTHHHQLSTVQVPATVITMSSGVDGHAGGRATDTASTSVSNHQTGQRQQENSVKLNDTASASKADGEHGQQQQQEIPMVPFGGESASNTASASTSAPLPVSHPEARRQQLPEIKMASSGGGRPTESTQPDADASSELRQQLRGIRIPKVRPLLHRVAGDLFTPHTVLIGPYQHEEGSYSFPSTGLKNKAVEDILLKHKVRRDYLELKLYKLVEDVMECYTCLPKKTMDKAEFSTMLLYDGCYLLSFFINFNRTTETSSGGAGSSNLGAGTGSAAEPYIDITLGRDILYLLENQIPLAVLEAILDYLKPTTDTKCILQSISEEVRSRLHEQGYISNNKQQVPATSKPSDLLHLVYSYFRRGSGHQPPVAAVVQEECSRTGRWRRATDYRKYAALQFKCREFDATVDWSILDIHLQGGTLYIPSLRVGADTWTMLRNLMALEEQEKERPVTAYCVFMSQVACTAEDVQLLQGAKILEHFMPSDEEAAKAFAYLCNGVALDIDKLERNYLRDVWHHLHKRCSVRMYNFMGSFRDKNCSDVFRGLVFFIGILIFASEMTQGFFSAYGYERPKHS